MRAVLVEARVIQPLESHTKGVVDGLAGAVGKARGGVLSRLEVGLARILSIVGAAAGAVGELLGGGLAVTGLNGSNNLVGGTGEVLGSLVEGALLGVGGNLLRNLISNGLAAKVREKSAFW